MSKLPTKPTNQADFNQNMLMVCRFCGKFAHGLSMFGSLRWSLFECDVITFLTWRGGGAAQNASVRRTRQSRQMCSSLVTFDLSLFLMRRHHISHMARQWNSLKCER